MRIVEVNGRLVSELLQIAVVFEMTPQNILQRGADKKVFLAQAQLVPVFGAVVRVQHARDVF